MILEQRPMPSLITGLRAALISAGAFACFTISAIGADAPLRPVIAVPLSVSVAVAPVAFQGNGQRHLVYEIQTTNFSSTAWTVKRIEVRSQDEKHLLGVEGGKEGLLWHPRDIK